MMLTLANLSKSFGTTQALAGVSIEIARGETVAVLGPSGCGKSTLLAVAAGLETPDAGEVLWDGQSLLAVPPHRRNFGLMFQDFALFPHLSVFDNIAFGLRMAGLDRRACRQRVQDTLALVGLPGFEGRDVNTLSGGEQQRVALARSLAPRPRLLMLDEPLGALDRALRERLIDDLRLILRQMQHPSAPGQPPAVQSTIYVTHDQEEAFALADRLVVMAQGRIEQTGAPQEIYASPQTQFVARFLGMQNLLPGRLNVKADQLWIATDIGEFPLPASPSPAHAAEGRPATLLLRPDAVSLGPAPGCRLDGRLIETSFRGGLQRTLVEVNDTRLSFDFPSSLRLPGPGEAISLCFDPQTALQVFP